MELPFSDGFPIRIWWFHGFSINGATPKHRWIQDGFSHSWIWILNSSATLMNYLVVLNVGNGWEWVLYKIIIVVDVDSIIPIHSLCSAPVRLADGSHAATLMLYHPWMIPVGWNSVFSVSNEKMGGGFHSHGATPKHRRMNFISGTVAIKK